MGRLPLVVYADRLVGCLSAVRLESRKLPLPIRCLVCYYFVVAGRLLGEIDTAMNHSDQGLNAGDNPVASEVVCVITRFRLRSLFSAFRTMRDYSRVQKKARSSAGLLHSALLFEGPRTMYTISLWEGLDAIPRFGFDIPEHVPAVRRVFSRARYRSGFGPEIWSTKWNLMSVSNNLRWEGFDLLSALDEAGSIAREPQ